MVLNLIIKADWLEPLSCHEVVNPQFVYGRSIYGYCQHLINLISYLLGLYLWCTRWQTNHCKQTYLYPHFEPRPVSVNFIVTTSATMPNITVKTGTNDGWYNLQQPSDTLCLSCHNCGWKAMWKRSTRDNFLCSSLLCGFKKIAQSAGDNKAF